MLLGYIGNSVADVATLHRNGIAVVAMLHRKWCSRCCYATQERV